jgi:hypothetical protein
MAKIRVPKPAAQAFNPHRRISDLLRWQMRHMQAAEMKLPYAHQTGININEIKTEAEAAAYLQKATAALARKPHLTTRVSVPKPAQGSFNKNRRISQLLKNQVEHFHELEKKLPKERQTGADITQLQTEGDVAHYISAITSRLLPPVNKK